MNERRKEEGSETDEREENKEEKTARARFSTSQIFKQGANT